MLSVCLITYNHNFFIEKAIQSVLSQDTNFKFELVIGEDYSTDNTRSICERYQNQYPEKINLLPSLNKNIGLKENFLRTFEACRGKYIAYLEGDDYWIASDKLQRQVDILEKNKDIAMVHTNCNIWDVAQNKYIESIIQTDGVCIREKQKGIECVIASFEKNVRFIKTSSCCYRKALLDQILKEDRYAFQCQEFPTQDFQLFLEMSMNGKFVFISSPMTMIGLHDSLSAAKDEQKNINYRFGFYKIGLYYIKKFKIPKPTIQIWIRRQLHYLLHMSFKNKDKELVEECVNLAKSVNYNMPIIQQILYWGTTKTYIRLFIYPFWKSLQIYRNK